MCFIIPMSMNLFKIIISLFTVLALKISKETLVAMISIYCILANLFVLKQISLFGYHPTASDAFSVGAILGLNLLQEYYGKDFCRRITVERDDSRHHAQYGRANE